MKTSLIIDDSLFKEAKREAERENKTLSETISYWARVGRNYLKKSKKSPKKLKTVNVGRPLISLKSRREWMDILDSLD